MYKNLIDYVDMLLAKYIKCNMYVFYMGLARSLMAISTFLTLITNDERLLFKNRFSLNNVNSATFKPFTNYNIFEIVSVEQLCILKWIICVFLLVVAIGWRPRFTGILHWYISYCFFTAAADIEGGDQIISIVTFLLIPICLLDNRKWHWINERIMLNNESAILKRIVSNTFFLLIKIQVAILYFHSALGKLEVQQWLNGTAIYYWINHPIFGISDWFKSTANYFFTNSYIAFIVSWGVIIFELVLAAGLLLNRKCFKQLFIAGVIFHFFIIIFHGLPSFFLAMFSMLTLYFMIDYYNFKVHLSNGNG